MWYIQTDLKRIKDSRIIIDALFDLISAQNIQFLTLKDKTIREAHNLALKTKMPLYDVVFVTLAKELGVELNTFDKRQAAIFRKYSN